MKMTRTAACKLLADYVNGSHPGCTHNHYNDAQTALNIILDDLEKYEPKEAENKINIKGNKMSQKLKEKLELALAAKIVEECCGLNAHTVLENKGKLTLSSNCVVYFSESTLDKGADKGLVSIINIVDTNYVNYTPFKGVVWYDFAGDLKIEITGGV